MPQQLAKKKTPGEMSLEPLPDRPGRRAEKLLTDMKVRETRAAIMVVVEALDGDDSEFAPARAFRLIEEQARQAREFLGQLGDSTGRRGSGWGDNPGFDAPIPPLGGFNNQILQMIERMVDAQSKMGTPPGAKKISMLTGAMVSAQEAGDTALVERLRAKINALLDEDDGLESETIEDHDVIDASDAIVVPPLDPVTEVRVEHEVEKLMARKASEEVSP